MELIQQGIAHGYITFSEDQKTITYLHQNKRRNYTNPEEQVQAETFLKLILEYGYPVEHIEQFVPVKMGSSSKEADIIVYKDAAHTLPYIVIECKSQDVSEQEFKKDGVDQALSYAHALAGTTKFIWATKGNKEEFYRFDKDKNTKTTEADIPYYGDTDAKPYKYAKGGFYTGKSKGQDSHIKTGDLKTVSEVELTRVFKQAHDALWDGGKRPPLAKYLMSGNTLPRLQTCDIENLLIPILPNSTQSKIIDIFESAYNSKNQKEAEAAALLASIDGYLLQALGINLPPTAKEGGSAATGQEPVPPPSAPKNAFIPMLVK